MLNGVNLNYIVVLLVTGAVLLAAIYHTILFSHRKTSLLATYSIYLWSTFFYCLFRTIWINPYHRVYVYFNPDETLQMISFAMYIRFAGIAMDLDPLKEKYAFLFTRRTSYVVFSYLLVNTFLVNFYYEASSLYFILKIAMRAYLLLLGLLLLLTVMRKRKSVFYLYLAAGAISMIAFGLTSSLINMISAADALIFGALSWLMFGFFFDVIFFSAAIGYRIRQEHNERETSLQQLLIKEGELQQKEIEKIKAIYETREEERSRIARDLHDEVGATLSGIALYSNLAKHQLSQNHECATDLSLSVIEQSASEMVNKLNDLVWAVNPQYDSVENMIARLQDYALQMGTVKGISCQFETDKNIDPIKFTMDYRKNIYMICKEAINNSVKYSSATQLFIKAGLEKKELMIMVSDNGNGFDVNTVTKGNGLRNMEQRTREIEGKLVIQSLRDKGTTIILSCYVGDDDTN